MLEREAVIKKHDGCPNRHHCLKNESKCAYLVKGECYIEQENIDFI